MDAVARAISAGHDRRVGHSAVEQQRSIVCRRDRIVEIGRWRILVDRGTLWCTGYFSSFRPFDASSVFAALGSTNGNSRNGIYHSIDGGVTWQKLSGGLPALSVGRISLADDQCHGSAVLSGSLCNERARDRTRCSSGCGHCLYCSSGRQFSRVAAREYWRIHFYLLHGSGRRNT